MSVLRNAISSAAKASACLLKNQDWVTASEKTHGMLGRDEKSRLPEEEEERVLNEGRQKKCCLYTCPTHNRSLRRSRLVRLMERSLMETACGKGCHSIAIQSLHVVRIDCVDHQARGRAPDKCASRDCVALFGMQHLRPS